jgi:hypothetical protein
LQQQREQQQQTQQQVQQQQAVLMMMMTYLERLVLTMCLRCHPRRETNQQRPGG